MPAIEFLLPLLLKALPFLAVGAAALFAYFHVKQKGAAQERAKWEEAQAEAKAKRVEQVQEAVSKDAAIDEKVRGQVEAIKQVEQGGSVGPGDIFKF